MAVRTAATRARHEEEAARMRSREPERDSASWEEVRPHLDAELGRLPARLREPVARHYLAGVSYAQIGEELGLAKTTVAGRVQVGVERLRSRLARRGVTLGAAALGALLAEHALNTAPAGLLAALPQLWTGTAAGGAAAGGAAPEVIAEGVLNMMFWAKVKTVAAVVCAAAVLAGGGGVAVKLAAAEPKKAPAAKPKKLNPRILAMADGTWLKMNPKREPDGRNYSGCCWGDWGQGPKIFYFGGAHFSYQYDDIAIYDIATNTWTKTWKPGSTKLNVEKSGTEKGKKKDRGASLRAAAEAGRLQATHTYQQVCWVPERKVFSYLGWSGHWEFDPVKNRWTCLFLPTLYQQGEKKLVPWTRWAVQTHHLYYSPVAKSPIAITTHRPQGDWIYDAKKKQWKGLKRSIGSMGGEIYSTYVPTLKAQVLSAGKSGFYLHRMVKDGAGWKTAWTPLKDVPKELIGCKALAYDSANDVVIALKAGNRKTPVRAFCFDPKTLKWSEVKPAGPVPKGEGRFAPLWYEEDHNAFFYMNRTGQTSCETWFFRYKGRKASK